MGLADVAMKTVRRVFHPPPVWGLVAAALAVTAGLLLIGWPVNGAFALIIVLAAHLFAREIARRNSSIPN
jgi:uncharacterized membrane protein HdeD (DUF308 family)